MANGQPLLGLQENLSNIIFFALQFLFKNKRDIVTNVEVYDLSTRGFFVDFSFLETARVDTYKGL